MTKHKPTNYKQGLVNQWKEGFTKPCHKFTFQV